VRPQASGIERENRELRRTKEIPMSGRGVLRGRREHRQRPSPASEHHELHRAHRPQALVTRTPTWRQRAGTRRLGERGRSPDPPRSLLTGPSGRRPSEAGDAHAHVIAAQRAAPTSGGTRSPGSWQCPGGNVRDPGRRASPRGDERDAVVPTSLPTSFTGSFGPHAGRVSERTEVDTSDEMADVSHLAATGCMIVG